MTTELETLREQKDAAYGERDACIAFMARMALMLGWRVGLARHEGEWEEDWRHIVFIDSPAGQLSWHYHDSEHHLYRHLPEYITSWDGHSTEEKYTRMARIPYLIKGKLRCGRCFGSCGVDDDDLVCVNCGNRVNL